MEPNRVQAAAAEEADFIFARTLDNRILRDIIMDRTVMRTFRGGHMSYLTLSDGQKLYYEDKGRGPDTLVMLHGWTSSHEVYSQAEKNPWLSAAQTAEKETGGV